MKGWVAVAEKVSLKSIFFSEEEKEQRRIFLLISEHCLPKLVCELHARIPSQSHFTDSERSLMSLIGSSFLGTVTPSKYHYAAHFGSLIQGYEGNGCHNFYPLCPFSGEDVQQIARKIPLKWTFNDWSELIINLLRIFSIQTKDEIMLDSLIWCKKTRVFCIDLLHHSDSSHRRRWAVVSRRSCGIYHHCKILSSQKKSNFATSN